MKSSQLLVQLLLTILTLECASGTENRDAELDHPSQQR